MQHFADLLAGILTGRGADEPTARLASQIAVACYQTARGRRDDDPRLLVEHAQDAFEQVLALGQAPAG